MTTQVTQQIFLLENIRYGGLMIHNSDMSASFPGEYIVLATQEVTFEIAKESDAEIVRAKIDAIETKIKKVRAAAQSEIASLEEAIGNLLSITHQPEVV